MNKKTMKKLEKKIEDTIEDKRLQETHVSHKRTQFA